MPFFATLHSSDGRAIKAQGTHSHVESLRQALAEISGGIVEWETRPLTDTTLLHTRYQYGRALELLHEVTMQGSEILPAFDPELCARIRAFSDAMEARRQGHTIRFTMRERTEFLTMACDLARAMVPDISAPIPKGELLNVLRVFSPVDPARDDSPSLSYYDTITPAKWLEHMCHWIARQSRAGY